MFDKILHQAVKNDWKVGMYKTGVVSRCCRCPAVCMRQRHGDAGYATLTIFGQMGTKCLLSEKVYRSCCQYVMLRFAES